MNILRCLPLLTGLWLFAMDATALSPTPDLAGVWFPVRFAAAAAPPADPALRRLASQGATLMREPGPPVFEYPPGEFGGLQLQDAALQSALRWQPGAEPTLATTCAPASIIQSMTSPFPFEILPATQLLVIRLEYFDLVRLVHMDSRVHPDPDYPHTKTGHSIGRWQDGVLTIDTTHLAPSVITTNGVAHTKNLHVIERLRLDSDGKTLHYLQQFDDAQVLQSPGLRYTQFRRQTGMVMPYDCDPGYALAIQQRESR